MNDLVKPSEVSSDLIKYVDTFDLMSKDEKKFLSDNKERLGKVITRTWMWRTENQHRSIISDSYHPTLHSKFHQAILEQKVHLEESIRLAKQFEISKLEIESLDVEIEMREGEIKKMEEVKDSESNLELKMVKVDKKKLQIEKQYKEYELQQMKVAMGYRMKEVQSWKKLQDDLIKKMKEQGLTDEQIWDKQYGEIEDMFFLFLNNMVGLQHSTDAAEVSNLVALAKFGIQQAEELGAGVYGNLVSRCNKKQLEALKFIEQIGGKPNAPGN